MTNEQAQRSDIRMERTDVTVSSVHINIPNVAIIYGLSKRGKSSLSRALSGAAGFLWLPTDQIFFSRVAPNLVNRESFIAFRGQPDEHFNIAKYIESDCYDHSFFVTCLKEELRYRLEKNPTTHTVLLDGYVLKEYSQFFTHLKLPPERTLALYASLVDSRYMIDDFDVTDYRYDEVLKHIRESFSLKCLSITVPKSRYQNFLSLGLSCPANRNPDSDTFAKYTASHLDDVVRASDRCVDIGCNAGYFCFKVADKTNGAIVGVDIAQNWLEVASHINNSIFLRENISFFKAEALTFLSANSGSFEVIHCASTYHYFREWQIAFLHAAHQALTDSGVLVLEVELANTGVGPEIIQRARGVDSSPCAFPNRAMFQQQISGLFTIAAEYESVFQKGSFYDRVYFHLRPVRSGAGGPAEGQPFPT
jgi:SAM-dependent methyltransferase